MTPRHLIFTRQILAILPTRLRPTFTPTIPPIIPNCPAASPTPTAATTRIDISFSHRLIVVTVQGFCPTVTSLKIRFAVTLTPHRSRWQREHPSFALSINTDRIYSRLMREYKSETMR